MRELGQAPAQNRAQADGARFFWSLFFAGPKKSDPGPGRSACRISPSGAPGARLSATGPGSEGVEPACFGMEGVQCSIEPHGKPGSPQIRSGQGNGHGI